MEKRTKVALLSVLIASGAPVANASAECPPSQLVGPEGGGVGVATDWDSLGVDNPNAEAGILLADNRAPANSLITRLGLVEDPRTEALAGRTEQFRYYVGERALEPVRPLGL